MNVQSITSLNQLNKSLNSSERTYLLIYKSGSEQSDCAYRNFTSIAGNIEDLNLASVDVSKVRDIHTHYNISTAPTLLEFRGKELKNTIKGCHDSSYFKAILEDAVYHSQISKSDKPQKRVVVYSTPTCTWCNTLKSYLKQNRIRFREIDVSRDQNAAEEMARRSGQQGVPQTDINGQMIVGFDKNRINQLLDING